MKHKRISQFTRNEKLKKKILANLKKIRKHNYPFSHWKIVNDNLPECKHLLLSLEDKVLTRNKIEGIPDCDLNKVTKKELSGLNSRLIELVKLIPKENLLSPDLSEKIGNLADRPKIEVKE